MGSLRDRLEGGAGVPPEELLRHLREASEGTSRGGGTRTSSRLDGEGEGAVGSNRTSAGAGMEDQPKRALGGQALVCPRGTDHPVVELSWQVGEAGLSGPWNGTVTEPRALVNVEVRPRGRAG